jgi:cytochrome c556
MKRDYSFTRSVLLPALISSLIFGFSTAWAGEVEKAVDYRQGVMNVYSWNMKAMSDMMKGKIPFDQKVFARHAKDLSNASSLNLMPGFPEDSEAEESDALPDIWLDFDDFEAKYKAFSEAANDLSEVAATGDKATLGKALEKAGKTCKACHKKYKD